MTRYREYDNQITPAIPYIAIYDGGGGQTINGSFLTWDSIKAKTSHFLYSSDDDRIQLGVNSCGLFEITFNISLSGSGLCYFDIYKNGSLIPEGRVYICPLMSGQDYFYDSGSIKYVILLQKDDYIQIKGTCSGGSGESVANTSRLIIKALPMRGWDNSSSGREMYSGGVQR